MGKFDRMTGTRLGTVCLACLTLAACAAKREQPEWAREAVQKEQGAAPQASAQSSDPRFDESGKLKPSGTRVSWLELPSGFRERAGNTAQLAAYEARDLPFDKLRAYLDERLVPKNALYLPTGFEYRQAGPAHTALALPPMHVTIFRTNEAIGEVRLVIEDLTPSRDPAIPPSTAASMLAKQRAQQE